ncbi:unnamed protein product [Timema podura]|uniref:Uncharacterized protein n=1 Tax=Timema podura TaxID=61482 RepID=A0ABN7P0I4_TIMPD|nr:unnamed protein product [Timema podura]
MCVSFHTLQKPLDDLEEMNKQYFYSPTHYTSKLQTYVLIMLVFLGISSPLKSYPWGRLYVCVLVSQRKTEIEPFSMLTPSSSLL